MNLQTALIALGVLLVAGIYLFSRWQEGRGGKSDGRVKRDRSEMSEPSLGRDEPSLDNGLVQEMDADFSAAEDPVADEPPPPDWDALEQEMAQPVTPAQPPSPADPGAKEKAEAEADTATDAGVDVMTATVSEPDDQRAPVVDEVEATEASAPDETADTVSAGEKVDRDGVQVETRPAAVAVAGSSNGVGEDDIPVLEARVDEAESVEDTDSAALASTPDGSESAPEARNSEVEVPVLEDPVTELAQDLSRDLDPDSGLDDPDDTDADQDMDMRDARPSLGSFLGSLKPINKLRHSLQTRLDAVKAEREESPPGPEQEDEQDIMTQKQKSSGQVDLLDMTAVEETDGGDASQGADAEQPEVAPEPVLETPAGETAGDDDAARKAPALGAAGRDNELLPAPGFDKLSQIDYYVKLSGDRDVSRDSVLAVYREAAAGLSKSHSVYGLRLPDKVWRDLEHEPEESRFGDLVITVQLADNKGPVSESEMTRFSNLVVKLSESTGRGFSFMAPIENAYQQALAIDRLRRKFDSIFVVNIKPTEDDFFEGAMIDRCASQIGLTPDDNRFYARYKPVGKQKVCLYSMANMTDNGEFEIGNMRGTRTRGVTFFTRPAVNRSPGAVFSEMVDAAKAFASRVKGEPIAPGYDDLSNDDIEAIRRSIEKVAQEMESYGIVPGSEEASRLF